MAVERKMIETISQVNFFVAWSSCDHCIKISQQA